MCILKECVFVDKKRILGGVSMMEVAGIIDLV